MAKVAIGCDHGGIVLKDAVVSTLTSLGAEVVDFVRVFHLRVDGIFLMRLMIDLQLFSQEDYLHYFLQ